MASQEISLYFLAGCQGNEHIGATLLVEVWYRGKQE